MPPILPAKGYFRGQAPQQYRQILGFRSVKVKLGVKSLIGLYDSLDNAIGVYVGGSTSSTPSTPAPGTPSIIGVSYNGGITDFTITWTNVSNETAFRVQYDYGRALDWQEAPSGSGNSVNPTAANVLTYKSIVGASGIALDNAGISHVSLRVRAEGAGGNSDWSNIFSAPPQIITTDFLATFDGVVGVEFNWTPSEDYITDILFYRKVNNAAATLVASLSDFETVTTDPGTISFDEEAGTIAYSEGDLISYYLVRVNGAGFPDGGSGPASNSSTLGLQHRWKFTEASGNTRADLFSSSSFHEQVGAVAAGSGPGGTGAVSLVPATAHWLATTSGLGELPQPFSIVLRFYPRAVPAIANKHYYLTIIDDFLTVICAIWMENSGDVKVQVGSSSTPITFTTPSLNNWHTLVIEANASSSFYGSMDGAATVSGDIAGDLDAPFLPQIGLPGATVPDALIGELTKHAQVLTPSAITAINAGYLPT